MGRVIENDSLMYYSLYRNHNDDVNCESNEVFTELKNNAIMDTFISLYKDEVEMAME